MGERVFAEYQIRVFRKEGELSVQLVLPTWSADEAMRHAKLLISHDLPRAEIWSDGSLVDTIEMQ